MNNLKNSPIEEPFEYNNISSKESVYGSGYFKNKIDLFSPAKISRTKIDYVQNRTKTIPDSSYRVSNPIKSRYLKIGLSKNFPQNDETIHPKQHRPTPLNYFRPSTSSTFQQTMSMTPSPLVSFPVIVNQVRGRPAGSYTILGRNKKSISKKLGLTSNGDSNMNDDTNKGINTEDETCKKNENGRKSVIRSHNSQKNSIHSHLSFSSIDSFFSKSIKVLGAFIPKYTTLSTKILSNPLKDFAHSVTSSKQLLDESNYLIKAFATNAYKGLRQNDHDANVLTILDVPAKKNLPPDVFWPNTSIFSIFDSHKGKKCSDFLRKRLHQNILKNDHFPQMVENAMREGSEQTDQQFIKKCFKNYKEKGKVEESGASVIMAILTNKYITIGNVGDCVAIVSKNSMSSYEVLSVTHTFKNESEEHRVNRNGGKFKTVKLEPGKYSSSSILTEACFEAVFPGKIKTTRSFGDMPAKVRKLGGNNKVLIPTPDTKSFKVTSDMDFIFLGTSSIFEVLSYSDILKCFTLSLKDGDCYDEEKKIDHHKLCGKCVDMIIKTSAARDAIGSLSCCLILLKEFNEEKDEEKSEA